MKYATMDSVQFNAIGAQRMPTTRLLNLTESVRKSTIHSSAKDIITLDCLRLLSALECASTFNGLNRMFTNYPQPVKTGK